MTSLPALLVLLSTSIGGDRINVMESLTITLHLIPQAERLKVCRWPYSEDPGGPPAWWSRVAAGNPMLHLWLCYDAEFVNRTGRPITLCLKEVTYAGERPGQTLPYQTPPTPAELNIEGTEYPVPPDKPLRKPVRLDGVVRDNNLFKPGRYVVQATFADVVTEKTYLSRPITVTVTQQDVDDYKRVYGGS
jgi:hypothetical protein